MLITYYLLQFAQIVDGSNVKLPNKNIDPNNPNAFSATIQNLLKIAFGALGAIAVLVIVIAAFQYFISAGDSQKVNKSKNTIIYALVGLVVAILAYSIVAFVLDGVFN